MNKQISLRIHNVKCVDETGSRFLPGSDEISAAAILLDGKNIAQVSPIRISSDFDTGETQKFSPPRTLVTLNIANNTSFPITVDGVVLLAEIDKNDFPTRASEIFALVKAEMDKKRKELEAKKQKAAVTVGGGTVNGLLPLLPLTGAELASIWIVIKPTVLKFIKNQILNFRKDDIFPAAPVSVVIPSANHQFAAGHNSTQFTLEFRGHDGLYRMTCDWFLS